MTTSSNAPSIRTLALRLVEPDDNPLWPVVQVLVDGVDVLAHAAPGWFGFDPDLVFAPDGPWLPRWRPRRVAIYRCSCGYSGCGALTAVVRESRGRVTWSDLRRGSCDQDLTDVCLHERPLPGDLDTWPALAFDAVAYHGELERVGRRRLWDSRERLVTLGLRRALLPMRDEVAALGLGVQGAWPVKDPDGRVRFTVNLWRDGRRPVSRLVVDLGPAARGDVDEAVEVLVARLRARLPAFAARRS